MLFVCVGVHLFQNNRKTIMDDPFIRIYIEDLLKNIRTQVLLRLIKPYTRIRIPFVSKVRNSLKQCVSVFCECRLKFRRSHGTL